MDGIKAAPEILSDYLNTTPVNLNNNVFSLDSTILGIYVINRTDSQMIISEMIVVVKSGNVTHNKTCRFWCQT